MRMLKGVKLLLESGTRIKGWIRNQTLNVEIGRERLNERMVRFLKIRRGEAYFMPGGIVVIKMPGSDQFWIAFRSKKVLEIRDPKGNLLERNWYLCVKCGTLTGRTISYKPDGDSGYIKEFECAQCGYAWEFKRI